MGQKKSKMLICRDPPSVAHYLSHPPAAPAVSHCLSSLPAAPAVSHCLSSLPAAPAVSRCLCFLPEGADAASSFFYSSRIAGLSELQSKFDTKLQFDIQSSTSSWTETVSVGNSDEQVQAFEKLKEHPEWGFFFRRHPYELEVGAKIAEGGQAEIYEALGMNKYDSRCSGNKKIRLAVKVFKEGFPLDELQRLWPPGVAWTAFGHRYFTRMNSGKNDLLCWALGGQLLDDGRFAFIFDRHWGDLRNVIDAFMLKRNGCPPFDGKATYRTILGIARGMCSLHELKILHNDLKASNVLVSMYNNGDHIVAAIADFESSVGVKGTGYWRAPEILLALRNRKLQQGDTLMQQTTQETDVYSFAMTCYEVITGRVPFEDHDVCDYDIILRGERPTLPSDPYSMYNNLVMKCWHEDPEQRPSFAEVVEDLKGINHRWWPTCDFKKKRKTFVEFRKMYRSYSGEEAQEESSDEDKEEEVCNE